MREVVCMQTMRVHEGPTGTRLGEVEAWDDTSRMLNDTGDTCTAEVRVGRGPLRRF